MLIEHPLPDTDAWVLLFAQADLPVLRHTDEALCKLRGQMESVNVRTLSNAILQDPLMTLRVFMHLARHRRKTQLTDITTVEQGLLMIGVDPFFHHFDNLPRVEDHLKSHPRALLGLLKVIQRSRRAAHWARDWAIHRCDLNVDEITLAALLHDIAELLMWCFAPGPALRVEEHKAAEPHLRSASAQIEVYGMTLLELQQALIRYWGLPQLLAQLMDHSNASNPRIRTVALAVDLARHTANGWSDAALPDDLMAIKELLRINDDMLPQKLGVDAACILPLLAATPSL